MFVFKKSSSSYFTDPMYWMALVYCDVAAIIVLASLEIAGFWSGFFVGSYHGSYFNVPVG